MARNAGAACGPYSRANKTDDSSATYSGWVETPHIPDAATRLAAIQATAGSAAAIFQPGYLQALREDWPD